MSTDTDNVIQLRERGGPTNTQYDVELPEPEPLEPAQPSEDAPDAPPRYELQPILPSSWRKGNRKPAAELAWARTKHRIAYHAFHLITEYIWKVIGYGAFGFPKLFDQLVGEWWLLRQASHWKLNAIQTGMQGDWEQAHSKQMEVRPGRGWILLSGLIILAIALGWIYLNGGKLGALAVIIALWLGSALYYSKTKKKPIVSAAVLTHRERRINQDIVIRAYVAAGLCNMDPNKPDQWLDVYPPGMERDGRGSRIILGVPYGRTFEEVVKARNKIASGMDVSTNQTFLTRDKVSERRHELYVADNDPLAVDAGRTPHLRLRKSNMWKPAPFGVDERGRPVNVSMMWNSILIGSQSRRGKTFAARSLALHAALDPYVKITITDGKASPDWRKFGLIADRYVAGLKMDRAGDPVEMLIDALQEVRDDVEVRNGNLSDLPTDICPDGKLTPEIARDPRFKMPVRLVVMEELQEYLDGSVEQAAAKEIAKLMVSLTKVGPSVGVIVLSATQKPSGIGSGDVGRLFTAFRDSHQIRFALKCGANHVSQVILGEGHAPEFDASELPIGDEYRGVGILYGASTHTSIVRTYLADGLDAEKILTAARKMREKAGTLSGFAVGEKTVRERRDVLADARDTFQVGEVGLHWAALAQRMAEEMPDYYADLTQDAISAQLRDLGVPSEDIKRDGRTLKGAKLMRITDAMVRHGHDER